MKVFTNCHIEGVPITAGGGASLGHGLPGFQKFIEDSHIVVSEYLGVSIGSIWATCAANGKSWEESAEILIEMTNPSLFMCLRMLWPSANPFRNVGFLDMVPHLEDICARHKLRWQDNLTLLGSDGLWPCLFQSPSAKRRHYAGADVVVSASLPKAMATSCCVPFGFRPTINFFRPGLPLVFDGGLSHPHPGSFWSHPAIIAKLLSSSFLDWRFPDRSCDFVTKVGHPGKNAMQMATKGDRKEMFDYGYRAAKHDLLPMIDQGLIPVKR